MEDEVRALLREMADEVPLSAARPAGVIRRARRRLAFNVTVAALTAGAVAFGGFVAVRVADNDKVTVPIGRGHPVEVSAKTDDGRLRCTARLPSTIVEPGDPTRIQTTLENLTDEPIEYSPRNASASVVLTDARGEALWGTGGGGPPIIGKYVPPTPLPAREKKVIGSENTPVRWPGPLTARPSCSTGTGVFLTLPPIEIEVRSPGPAPTADEALGSALLAAHGIFDSCRPTADGSWTTGLIHAPDGSDIPPLHARCAARIEQYEGFAVVSLLFVSPPTATGVEFGRYADTAYQTLPPNRSTTATRWTFVITTEAVREFSLETATRTRGFTSGAYASNFYLEDGRWKSHSTRCGYESWANGSIDFVSMCFPG